MIFKKYGLVLAGGGAKGAYQIGAWKALVDMGITFDAIAGTSIGSINGALIAAGDFEKAHEISEIEGITVDGLMCVAPICENEAEIRSIFSNMHRMFIDIGAKDKEEAETMVSIGDPITFKCWFEAFPNNLVMCKALDNRLGCYVMMEVLKRVDTRATVYGVGTVQEEVGLKGAKTSAFKLNPDLAIALDVTLSGDHPGIKPEEAPVVAGKGPAIILADASGRGILTQQSVKDMLIKAGDENDIPYQLEVSDGGTTDGIEGHGSNGGTAV